MKRTGTTVFILLTRKQ